MIDRAFCKKSCKRYCAQIGEPYGIFTKGVYSDFSWTCEGAGKVTWDMTPPLNCPFFLEQVLLTDGSVYCDNVQGSVKAGGSVNCCHVGGNVNAGGSVRGNNVGGNVVAGGSVSCGKTGCGNIVSDVSGGSQS
jgi:hypothetical protein